MRKIFILLLTMSASIAGATDLPKLALDTKAVTVSGVSSGAYMAGQFHLAHANWVKGAGLIAGGPYYCGQNSLLTALGQCVNKRENSGDLVSINQQVKLWQQAGKLAPANELAATKVWLFHGTKDEKVIAAVTDDLAKQYQQWLPAKQIKYITDKAFAHHFPTLSYGSDCQQSATPYLANCHYDAAGEILSFLLADVQAPVEKASGKLYSISQQQVFDAEAAGMAEQGFVYLPAQCAAGNACKLHISFHGCQQNSETIATKYAEHAGFNRWADSNDLVVLYPQTVNSMVNPLNPKGCWDWWGYTGDDYATRDGLQIKGVVALVKALAH